MIWLKPPCRPCDNGRKLERGQYCIYCDRERPLSRRRPGKPNPHSKQAPAGDGATTEKER